MILALLILLGAHTGTIVAEPIVINSMCAGSIITSTSSYYDGKSDGERSNSDHNHYLNVL